MYPEKRFASEHEIKNLGCSKNKKIITISNFKKNNIFYHTLFVAHHARHERNDYTNCYKKSNDTEIQNISTDHRG